MLAASNIVTNKYMLHMTSNLSYCRIHYGNIGQNFPLPTVKNSDNQYKQEKMMNNPKGRDAGQQVYKIRQFLNNKVLVLSVLSRN